MTGARVLAFLAVSLFLMAGEDPFSGVWQLNLSKSKIPPPIPKSQIARVHAGPSGIRISEEVVSETGERLTITVDAKFDGKDYPVNGSPYADTVSYQRVNRFTIKGVGKKAGRVIMNETVVVSPDNKTMTGTYSGADTSGKSVTAVAVFDRQ
ncbi:MAG TPA: hypothetical protein VE398_14755 [Acidobacteriota bacterium]|nr:hypothetical protein [Acidobacteriota bacterium]